MKIYTLPIEMVNALRSWFHPKDRSIILAPATFIEGEEIVTPAHPTAPDSPAHNRGRLYWKNGCWTQLDEFGNEQGFCAEVGNWSPTVTQGGLVAATVNFARYSLDEDMVSLRARLAITGTGTAGSSVTIGNLPFSAANGLGTIGTIEILDSGVAFYVGSLDLSSVATLVGRAHLETNTIGIDPNFALANNDLITIEGKYERA